jgi:predicted nuclease of predicted toxin-antitoxin system
MTFILDENLSWRIAKLIQSEFPDCIHIIDIFDDTSPLDISIWNYAFENNMAIITIDNDFNILSKFYNSLPKIIHLQVHNESNKAIANRLISHAEEINKFISNENLFLLEIY